ncbi:MAG TPA: DUF4012 domain-containing protein, partial [Actinoplanes sp.]|nr:DUF4012 domain-containing protein [Actinoplanes sp.]
EVRATGGMPGAYLVVRAADGRVTIVDEGVAAALVAYDRPVLPLDADDLALYSEKMATFPGNVNLTPDFPTAAALAREMHRRRTGRTVDGVLATDPVALAHLMRAIGPVQVPGGDRLTAANTVSALLSRVYAERTPEEQDRYFSAAARAIFQALLTRPVAPGALLAALARAAGERRLLVWSAEASENARLAGTVLAGVLPADAPARPTVGVFLNDGTGAKLSYYLAPAASLQVTDTCRRDRRRELRLRVSLRSTAPAKGLSRSVLGLERGGAPYTVRTLVSVYGPTRGALESMAVDGRPSAFGSGRDGRRRVGVLTVDLRPGQSRTIEATLLTAPIDDAAEVRPQLRTTPLVTPWKQSVGTSNRCP